MNDLLLWYALVFGGLAVGVYRVWPHAAQRPPLPRHLPAWMASMLAHADPIDGYQDPIFSPRETHPMELTDATRPKATRTR